MYGRPSYPLPHPELMIDYLDLYPVYRKDQRSSYLNAAKYGYEKLVSKVTGKPPVDDQLDDMVKKRREDMEDASSFEDWYRLIFELRINAETAQTLKYGGDESVLRSTLHACANLIIDELERCNVLANKIVELKCRAELKVKEIAKNHELHKDNSKSNADYNKVVLELARLGVVEFVNIAMQHKLLPTLNIPQEQEMKELGLTSPPVDMSVPILLHRNQAEWFYRFKYQTSCKHISFDEFRKNAITKAEERKKLTEESLKMITTEKASVIPSNNPSSSGDLIDTPDKQASNTHGNLRTSESQDRASFKTSEGTISNSTTTSTELSKSKGGGSQNQITVTECKDSFFNNTSPNNPLNQSKDQIEHLGPHTTQTPPMTFKQKLL
jgi:hypothetical protein